MANMHEFTFLFWMQKWEAGKIFSPTHIDTEPIILLNALLNRIFRLPVISASATSFVHPTSKTESWNTFLQSYLSNKNII